MSTISIHDAVSEIMSRKSITRSNRALLVGVSGIDGSGKGFIAQKIVESLSQRDQRVALINIDGWLNLPHIRFNQNNPANNFYDRAIRFDELFSELILPLKERRSIDLQADFTEETASAYKTIRYSYTDIDFILLEGIFLFKKVLRGHFDLKIWVDCSFQTALRRAIGRAQEGLPPTQTTRAYEEIYFPAQLIHFERDRPQETAELIIPNDL